MRFLALGIAAMLFAATLQGRPMERQIIGAEQDHSLESDSGDCAHFFNTTFTIFRAQVSDQEQREIDLDGIDQLRVVASAEGGVSVRGWNKPHARLIVCRYAVAHEKSRATRLLGMIQVSHGKGEIEAFGPPNDENQAWWVNMILYVPRRASVDVRASNGGVAIRNMGGKVTAHAGSGGISVAQSSGRYTISTDSGGITLDRVTGDVDAVSREGAIALKLHAADLPTIEAKTADAGHINCTLKGCEEGTWSVNRQALRIGGGIPHIRLTTAGAAITIAPVF
jgi:hypothetical protein